MMFALALGLLASAVSAHTFNICWHHTPQCGGSGTLSVYSTIWHTCGEVDYSLIPAVIIDGVHYPYTSTLDTSNTAEVPVTQCVTNAPDLSPYEDACNPGRTHSQSCFLRVDIPNFSSGTFTVGTTGMSYVEEPACTFLSGAGVPNIPIDMCDPCATRGDDDSDGICNDIDQCPTDPLKTVPGVCGCGIASCPGTGGTDETGDIFAPVVLPTPPIIDCGRAIQYNVNEVIPIAQFTAANQDAAGALTFVIAVPIHYLPGYVIDHNVMPARQLNGVINAVTTSETCDASATYHTITQQWNYYFSQSLLEYVPHIDGVGIYDYFVGEFQFDGDVNVTDAHGGRAGQVSPNIRRQTNNLPFRIRFDTTAVSASATANNDLFISSPLFDAYMILEQLQLVTGTGLNQAEGGTARVFIETSINPGFKLNDPPTINGPLTSTVVINEITGPSPYEDRCLPWTDLQLEDGTATPCFQYWEYLITAESASPCDLSGLYNGEFTVDYNRVDLVDLVDISDVTALTYAFTLEELCSVEITDQSDALFSTLKFQDPDQANLETYEFFVGETVDFVVYITNPIVDLDSATLTSFELLEGPVDLINGASFSFTSSAAVIDVNGDATIKGSFFLDDATFNNVRDTWKTYSFEAVSAVVYDDGTAETVRHLLQVEETTSTSAQREIKIGREPEMTVDVEETDESENAGVQSQVSIAMAVAATALLY